MHRSHPLPYPCLRAVFSYLKFEKRKSIAKKTPGCRRLNTILPFRFDSIKFHDNYEIFSINENQPDRDRNRLFRWRFYIKRKGTVVLNFYHPGFIRYSDYFFEPDLRFRVKLFKISSSLYVPAYGALLALQNITIERLEVKHDSVVDILDEISLMSYQQLCMETKVISHAYLQKLSGSGKKFECVEVETTIEKLEVICQSFINNPVVGSMYSGEANENCLKLLKDKFIFKRTFHDEGCSLTAETSDSNLEVNIYTVQSIKDLFILQFKVEVQPRGTVREDPTASDVIRYIVETARMIFSLPDRWAKKAGQARNDN